MTAGQYAYRNWYLKSREWRWLRMQRLTMLRERYGQPICECCNVPFEKEWRNGHHVTYPDNWLDTTLDQIRMVCVPCHQQIHQLIEERLIEQHGDVDYWWEQTRGYLYIHRTERGHAWQAKLEKRRLRKLKSNIPDN